MKYLLMLLTISCTSNTASPDSLSKADSLLIELEAKRMTDSAITSIYKDIADSSGSWRSPVRVIKARMVNKEYSNNRDIQLTYKNLSNKKVDAVKFKWYVTDAFGEPADAGGVLTPGLGGGFLDDGIGPGKTRTSTWSISSRDGKKVTSAFAYTVAFSDGTKWELP